MPVREEHKNLYPNQHKVAEALLVLLFVCGGKHKALRARDCYEPIAIYLHLSNDARNIVRSEYYTNDTSNSPAWHNIVQWGRRELRDFGFLQASPHGVWRLSDQGCSKAERLIATLSPPVVEQLQAFRIPNWEDPLDGI